MDWEISRGWNATRASHLCVEALAKMGLEVSVTTDPDLVSWTVEKMGKPYFTPWLDPRKNDFTERNYFWIFASRERDPVVCGGGRLDQCDGSSSRLIKHLFDRAYGEGTVTSVSPECDRALSGRVTYLGDLFSAAGKGLGRQSVRYFLGVANYLSSVHFQSDVTYSFMRFNDVRRGSADTNGLDTKVYSPLDWGRVPEELDSSGVIVYRHRRNDKAYFDLIIEELGSNALRSHPHCDHRLQEVRTGNS